jgi:ketosteroid isomerase-like protein
MKKLIAGAIFLGASSLAFAQPGCGVGAMIWKGQSGIAPHVLAATTNGTASQTVSMTFGIVGCHTNQSVQSMAMLLDSRGEAIAAEISRGQGENLEAMAVALGVQPEDRNEFYDVLAKNFNTIFPTSDTTSGEAVDAIVALLEQNNSLSKYVAA